MDMENINENVDTSLEETQETTEQGPDVSEATGGLGGDENNLVDDNQENESSSDEHQDAEFNPDDLDFSEDTGDYVFGDYDLSTFKDEIDFTNENVRNIFMEKSKELKEKGFSQDQVNYLLQKEIDYIKQNRERQALNKEQVMKELQASLNLQQKRDYKATGNFLKEALKGDAELEKLYNEAMSNPAVYKLIHKIYTKNLSGKSINNLGDKSKETREKKIISFDEALDKYTARLQAGNKDVKDILNSLSEKDREQFKNTFGI